MVAEEGADVESPIARVMADIQRKLVLRVARADRDDHRDIYDALGDDRPCRAVPLASEIETGLPVKFVL